jgi:uncharacterized protein (TIGR00730 family)
MAKPRSVCVYCGSKVGKDPAYLDAACQFGRILAKNEIELVYGGGSLGLMGVVAESALEAGGRVVGIIPKFLREVEAQLEDVSELIVTHSMHERKQIMFERSNAFVSLPGGIGTLDETVEIMTWAQLSRHNKPIILLDIHGYWSPFTELLAHMIGNGFVGEEVAKLWTTVDGPEAILPAIDTRLTDKDLAEKTAFNSIF